MFKFGDYVTYHGLFYQVVGVSDDDTPLYTLKPVRTVKEEIVKTVTSSQIQTRLNPSGGANLTSILGADIELAGIGTAIAQNLGEGLYKVRFDTQGGNEIAPQILESGAKMTKPTDPTKDLHTFINWYYNADGSGNAVNFGTKTVTDDLVLYAKWTIDTFTVTYDSNEGSAVAPETVDYGDTATEPADPTRVGYLFDAWYTDDTSFEDKYDFDTLITGNITLYAKWIEAVTVTFDSNEGSDVDAQVIPTGGLATEPVDPTLEGNTFAGWFYDDSTFLEPVDFATNGFSVDTTVYAKWDTEG